MYYIAHFPTLNEIKEEDFDLIIILTAFGFLYDFAHNKKLKAIIKLFNNKNKAIDLVDIAADAVVSLTTLDVKSLKKDRKITVFSYNAGVIKSLNKRPPFY